jgi:lipoprotein-anchoring transpeptidase ErfK/SrfK
VTAALAPVSALLALVTALLVPAATVLAVVLVAAAPAAAAPSAAASADPTPSPSSSAVPALTLTASPTGVVAGRAAVLTAALGRPGLAGQALELSAEAAGASAFTPLAGATTGADGHAVFSESPAVTTTYRVDFAGAAGWAPASAETTVAVAPRVTLTGPGAVFGWREIALKVAVSAPRPGANVVLQLRRGTRLGSFAYRVTIAADAACLAGASAVVVVRVKSPNTYHVPIAPAHFIVVDKSQYRLYYLEHGWVVRVFDCVLGRPALPTPLGHYHIYAKDPHMGGPYGPRRMRYLGLFAIHGTDEPWLLHRFPRNYSHGCTRLSDAHILWLYPRCPVGTPVWNVP